MNGLALLTASATCVIALGALVGCGSQSEIQTSRTGSSDPGTVALRYNQALFTGDFPEASRYVIDSDRNAFLALTLGWGTLRSRAATSLLGASRWTGPPLLLF